MNWHSWVFVFTEILEELGKNYEDGAELGEDQIFVKFFDDDDFELLPVDDLNKVESYSCKNKKKYIRSLS